ncbi:hypothetical protein J7M07_07355, partial [bacterium]|nr:hypothetical protein [bacterium]
QEKYRLSGAGALAEENYFWLRSKGAFWKGEYDNIRVSGGANLRGYFDCGLSFKRIIASNLELELPFPLPLTRRLSMMLRQRVYLFYDWGRVYDDNPFLELSNAEIDALEDAGVTSSIFKNGIGDFGFGVSLLGITVDFPIYLSQPSIVNGKEKWDFRWTIGINKLF